jgi:hypothetical protein
MNRGTEGGILNGNNFNSQLNGQMNNNFFSNTLSFPTVPNIQNNNGLNFNSFDNNKISGINNQNTFNPFTFNVKKN